MPAGTPGPTYSLTDAQRLIKLARIGDTVLNTTRQDYPDDLPKVKLFIQKVFLSLDANAFVDSKMQTYGEMADIYATQNADGPWYVKFRMEHGQVIVLSCHYPKYDVVRVDGQTIKAVT